MIDLRIDGTSFNFEEWYNFNNTLKKQKTVAVTGVVADEQQRNATAEISAWFRGAGLAYNNTVALTTCNYAGDACYSVKVMPTVNNINNSEGYTTGG